MPDILAFTIFDIAHDVLVPTVTKVLEDIQASMYARARAFREEHTAIAESYEELKALLSERGGSQ